MAPTMQRVDQGILTAFDTETIKSRHTTKYNTTYGEGTEKLHFKTAKGWSWQGLGRANRNSIAEDKTADWENKGLIWVCAEVPGSSTPVFYSHIGKLRRFHHSSFTAGDPVIGAGEWIVENGRLLKINANSGHYQPTIDHLFNSVLAMTPALNNETTVMLWDTESNQWVHVTAGFFLDKRRGGGRYKAHPLHTIEDKYVKKVSSSYVEYKEEMSSSYVE
jgi:hypothetical protein